jgi:hypothetical protein
MPEYSHLLIPDRFDYIPRPNQIVLFFSSLFKIGGAPHNASFKMIVPSGQKREVKNPFTGQSESWPVCNHTEFNSVDQISSAISELQDYRVVMSGKGPPAIHPLKFNFSGQYDFCVYCHVRPEIVSMSNWHGDNQSELEVTYFGEPCSQDNTIAIYTHPNTFEKIEVSNAGFARFWIEFEFGKSLFPDIHDSLDLLAQPIVESANKSFGIQFIQGCHWCA